MATAWYIDKGPENDVVISTRIRLARNFKNIPFPVRMSREQGEQVLEKCKDAILNSNTVLANEFDFMLINSVNPVDRQSMVEKHLISPEMLKDIHSRGILLSKDERISVMINEEDHLRIQCMFPGMQLDEAGDLANKIDNLMEERIEYAFSEDHGYLTCCPTNVGTGMRASLMVHLPALTLTGHINSILSAVSKLGIAVRGLYGEGTEATGNIFQVSNQVTLGLTEEEAVENLKSIVRQVISQERVLRQKLMQESRIKMEDRLLRSFGIFMNARVMSSDEFMKLLSDVRLAVDLDIINNIEVQELNELMVATQPANIMKRFGGNLNTEERDIKRAELIKERLGNHA